VRFVVLGAGAIGAYVGAALAKGGATVTLIARGAHLAALRRNGVRVISSRGDFEAHPEATDDLAAVVDADVLFVGLKAHSLPEIAPEVGSLLSRETTVVPAQNGIPWWFFQSFGGPLEGTVLASVDPAGVISRAIPAEQIVGCVSYPATEIQAPGVIRHVEGTRFAIGEPTGGQSDRCQLIAAAFRAGGLKCSVEEQIREQLWLKLIGNVAFNTVTAITGATLGQLGTVPEMVELLRTVLREGADLGKALGIDLPVPIERRLEAGIRVGDHKSSMLQDLEAGKPLEIQSLTGAVIEIATKVGVPVPATAAVDACLRLAATVRAGSSSGGPAPSRAGHDVG
jgi:2-dehydropantoate 2-reductase